MVTNAQRSFFRWTWFRAWFPVLFFLAYWANSYFNYHFGLLIRDPLMPQTYFYLWGSMALFILGYAIGLGRPKRVMVGHSTQVWRLNENVFKYLGLLMWVTFIGAIGLVVDRLLSGAGSVAKTLKETEFVRQEYASNTTIGTTISMALYAFSFVTYSTYFLAVATRYAMPKYYHLMIYGTYVALCFSSFLTANRGNFFSVFTYVAFMIFYVQGSSLKEFLFTKRYRIFRITGIVFVILAFVYFFFISRYRSTEDGLVSDASYYRPVDRYGLYKMNFDEHDITAFLTTYTYMTEGYQYVDAFLKKAPFVSFRPSMLIGVRTLRQFWRFLPGGFERDLSAVRVGNTWRLEDGMSIYGWPTIWGWNLAMFGYFGAVLFMFCYGWWLGYCSGLFLRFASLGALMVCFANYSVLMNSYNSLGGDVFHQVAIFVGVWVLVSTYKHRRFMCLH